MPVVAPRAASVGRWRWALALAAALPFLGTLRFPFVYDDTVVIAANAPLHSLVGIWTALHVPYWPAAGHASGLYRPATQLAFSVLWNMAGGAPWLFHLWAIVLHVAVTLALAELLVRALPRAAALSAALLFAVDPVHVEAVASVVGSAESLATLAVLALVALVLRARRDDVGTSATPTEWGPALAAAVAYAIAIGAKESAAAAPALVFACCWGWRARSGDRRPGVRAVLALHWRLWVALSVTRTRGCSSRGGTG